MAFLAFRLTRTDGIGEMLEIASTFEHLGVTPSFHQGAAEMYRLLSQTPYASETPENADKNRPTRDTIRAVVDLLQPAIVADEQAAD